MSHRQSSQGSILIIVMVVCIGLVSVALFFANSTQMAYRGSASDLAGRQSQRAIDGAAQYAEYLMMNSGSTNAAASSSAGAGAASTASTASTTSGSTIPTNLLPDPTSYQSEAVPVGDATFWFIGDAATSGSSASTSSSNTSAGTNVPTFGLVDEASKLNLNTASLYELQQLPNMPTSLASAIIAWRTSGTSSSGSTSTTSASTTSSSGSSKGGPFESIYELAQVAQSDGDDPSILYGTDTNLNHVLDGSESQGVGQYTPGLYEYVTVFSREPKIVPGTSQPRISVTTQKSSVSSSLTADTTTTGDLSSASSASTTPTTLSALLTSMLGQNREREIMGNFDATGFRRPGTPPPTPPASVLEFYIRGKLSAAELDELTPYITSGTGTSPYKNGLINVNTASATVLACVPGITTELASQIVSARQTQTTPSTNLAWLVPILGTSVATQAGQYLTTQTFQVTADVAAVGPGGLGYRRTLFVIDGSNGTPQIVYRRDMTALGWALGPNALQTTGTSNPTTQ